MLLMTLGESSPTGMRYLIIFLTIVIVLAVVIRQYKVGRKYTPIQKLSEVEEQAKMLRSWQIEQLIKDQKRLDEELRLVREENSSIKRNHKLNKWLLNLIATIIIMLFGQILMDLIKEYLL